MTTDEMLADGLMTIREAADFLAVSRSTLYVEMDGGRLAYCKIGRARRIPRRAVVELAAANIKGNWRITAEPDSGSSAALQPIGG
jgi:excisionase family DNA binding protein